MSQETREWLSTNTLIGFTDSRGDAWHHRAGDNNTYPNAIPVADVEKRLFDWEATEQPLYVRSVHDDELVPVPNQKAIVRSDNGHVMGIFKPGYQPHQYNQWLLGNVAQILDDRLQVGSAGLLKGGAVAWVSVEVPETIVTPEGVAFRPFLMATTSFDGSLATTYKRGVTNVVCDNTMAAFLREAGETLRVKHSAKSLGQLQNAKDALGIVYSVADDFALQVAALTAIKVDDRQFEKIVESLSPLPEDPQKHKAAVTQTEKKRGAIRRLYRQDERVAPWAGSAFGVWQAYNTYGQHEQRVVNATRQERNMLRTANGEIEKTDTETVERVLSLAV